MQDKTDCINNWLKKYPDLKVIRDIKSGKEASLVLVVIGGVLRCLKIYNRLSMALKKGSPYLAGKHFRTKSIQKSVSQGNKFGAKLLKRLWVKREFYLLKKLHRLGALVPLVYDFDQNSIIMEYLGTESIAAPLIKDVVFSAESAKSAFESINKSVEIFLQCGIVHADLSEFNIIWWHDLPYIIDFPQSVDIRTNPNYQTLLVRDVRNIVLFFSQWILINGEQIIAEMLTSPSTPLLKSDDTVSL